MPGTVTQLHPAVEEWRGFFPSGIVERPAPRRWIVDGKIPFGEVILLAGSPKVGKSLLAQQLLSSAALELPWIGFACEKTPGIGLFFEDDEDELKTRQLNICENLGVDVFRLDRNLELNSREQDTKRLFRFDAHAATRKPPGDCDHPIPTPVWEALWQSVADYGYKLIVFDHAAKVFGAHVLNQAEKINNVIEECYRAVRSHGVTIIIMTHTNRVDPATFTGSQAWLANVRAAINMRFALYEDERRGERIPGQRIISNLGGNYGPDWQPITVEWSSPPDAPDRGIWSPVEVEPLEKRPQTQAQRTELYYELLRYLGKCVEHNKMVPIDELDKQSLPSRVRRWRKIPFNDLYAGQQWMVDNKMVDVCKVAGKCCIRPRDMRYTDEQPWKGE